MSGVIRWERPPEPDPRGVRGRSLEDWPLISAQLRGRPGAWGLISQRSQSPIAVAIREGRLAGFAPAGAFDAKCVRVGGVLNLYARYVGEMPP